jgi:hypothetical protein
MVFMSNQNNVSKTISEFKQKIYSALSTGNLSPGTLSENEVDSIKTELMDIKSQYIQNIINNIYLLQGEYTLNYILDHNILDVGLSKVKQSSTNKYSYRFNWTGLPETFQIDVDNFLGQIMANILFSPDKSINPISPAVKISFN